jgi:hypothetical protein
MDAVSKEVITLIKNLQTLQSLKAFALAGGTNLALRFQHRKSDDIDLFTDGVIGRKGYEKILNDVKKEFGPKLISFQFPCDENDQFIFARFFILEGSIIIKVEILQNMKLTQPLESLYGIKLISKIDIGLFKLVSAANRLANKDIYDLDYITDEISLIDLFYFLSKKKNKYNHPSDQNIFNLNGESCPLEQPELLLRFDEKRTSSARIPNHSNDTIYQLTGKSWHTAKFSYRKKVRDYYTKIGYEYQFNH